MNISVCMATYNGEAYVVEQMQSILEQLTPDDEVIVVDDFSTDLTVTLLHSLDDSRIKIYLNDKNMQQVFSFGRAISLAKNDIILLSDQDDVWIDGRVSIMLNRLHESGAMLLSSNQEFIDVHGTPIPHHLDALTSKDSTSHLKNTLNIFIGKANYFGCAMAFRRELTGLILPIPSYVECHDLWIALASNLAGSNVHMDDYTVTRKIHDKNFTDLNRNLFMKIRSRFILGLSIIAIFFRIRGWMKSLNDH